ncbi:unnamed protein product [Dovyalis caffra]|uniref:Uncharacterized protein n=1 Tax=Dovyalis caffra TaxID=77055 RepID=A0AAV1QYZ6_9ROSI|nr:unnamed protein product [Dovyalis caffra]
MSQQRVSSMREQPLIRVDMKINDMVGNGIFGILFKWVNYGKGWRPRWFVLQDGVLPTVINEVARLLASLGTPREHRIRRKKVATSIHDRLFIRMSRITIQLKGEEGE